MEDPKQNIIDIGEEDEIIDIINKIKNVPERTVTLVIPKGAVILQDVINLKILQRKAEELGKEISLSKSGVEDVYKAPVSLPAMKVAGTAARPERKMPLRSRTVSGPMMVSDMVRKNGTVDLRKTQDRNEAVNIEKRPEAAEEYEMRPRAEAPQPVIGNDIREKLRERIEEEEREVAALPVREDPIPEKDGHKTEVDDYFARLGKSKSENRETIKESLSAGTGTDRGEKSIRRIEREELFGESEKTDAVENEKKFDFSYGHDDKKKKKKKRGSVLPTISANYFAVFILICIIVASLSLIFILPKANIVIALQKESVQDDYDFILDKGITEIDAEAGKLPARDEEIVSEMTQNFAATGKKQISTKATGEITILNECTTTEQLLVAGTRFLSKDGSKIFKIEATAVIAGYSQPDDEVVPGAKTVKVTAENAGETFNIGATTFTIPALQEMGSKKYGCLYARSDKAMAGGSDKEVAVISQSDYDNALKTLTAQAKEDIGTKSSEQKSENLIYIDDESNEGEVSVKSAAKVNDVADKFDLTVSIKKTVLTVEKDNLETVLGDRIKSSGDLGNANAVQNSLTYQIGDTIDKDGQTVMSVSAAQDFTIEMNIDEIKKAVTGKDKQELNDYFSKMNGIRSTSVELWPFWVKKAPNSSNKIFIITQEQE